MWTQFVVKSNESIHYGVLCIEISVRREADLPASRNIETKQSVMEKFIEFYNKLRPHYALGLRTPDEIYYKV